MATQKKQTESRRDFVDGSSITQGLYNTETQEKVPVFKSTSGEKVFRKGNSWMILGRDRPSDRASGYGGTNEGKSFTIDLVVGRMGWDTDSTIAVENNFGSSNQPSKVGDSARIYISQKTDVDDNFDLKDGLNPDSRSRGKSAIAIKADDIRMIARRSLKIITHGAPQAEDSFGLASEGCYGIDIIAGNKTFIDSSGVSYLQPMVKGDNLRDFLEQFVNVNMGVNDQIISIVEQLLIIVTNLQTDIRQVKSVIPGIAEPSPNLAANMPSVSTSLRIISSHIDLANTIINNLQSEFIFKNKASRSILSKYNNVN